MQASTPQPEVKNTNRRTFLTVGLTGAGAFILGKLFGNDVARLLGREEVVTDLGDIKQIGDFTIKQSKDEMVFSDRSGEEIFIIDKKSFQE